MPDLGLYVPMLAYLRELIEVLALKEITQVPLANGSFLSFSLSQFQSREHLEGKEAARGNRKLGYYTSFRSYLTKTRYY